MLIIYTYNLKLYEIGGVIATLHDFSDIFVSLMKLLFEISGEWTQMTLFFMMLVSWLWTRIYVFPFVAIH